MNLSTKKMLAEADGHIGWLTFNQPERRNAMSMEMWQGVGDALEAFQADPAIRVVVMRGAGGKAFVSGADISEFDQHRASAEQKQAYGATTARGNRALRHLDKPLVAMIQGFCIGGGLAIALNADVRIATPESTFGIPAARLGLGYEFPGLATLARLVGPSVARDIL
ncbi:MAG: enoyl-CoA hydratase-related protein, partial [Tepidiformaceae bacterium]